MSQFSYFQIAIILKAFILLAFQNFSSIYFYALSYSLMAVWCGILNYVDEHGDGCLRVV